MNKRIKLKKGILRKKCNDKCGMYRIIKKEKLITCNGCIGCKHIKNAVDICFENLKFWNSMTEEEKQKYEKEKSLNEIALLSSKHFAEKVDKEFNSTRNIYSSLEYMRILRAIKLILLNGTTDEELIINHMKSQIMMRFYM